MLTPEQLAARKIGGSDVAVILGLSKFKTPMELWAEKTGAIEPPDLSDNDNVVAGNVMEDAIADLTAWRLSKRDGRTVKLRRSNLTITNPKYPWLTAHIDRDIVGEDRGVEIKNVGARAARDWGEPGTDQIPDYYLPQPHTYMIVKGYPSWVVSAYFGGGDLRLYDIEFNQDFADIIIEATHKFWHENVLKNIPPDFDPAHPAAEEAIKRLYPGTDGREIKAPSGMDHWLSVFQDASKKAADYEKMAVLAKSHMLAEMGQAAIMDFPDGTILIRKVVQRKGYTVEASSYVDARVVKPKEK